MKRKIFKGSTLLLTTVLGLSILIPAANADSVSNADLPQDTQTAPIAANSQATVKVQTGYLTLNSVPDLNFGTAAQQSTSQLLPLVNNKTGNGQTAISITDSRDGAMGWTLKAALGSFGTTASTGWKLNLNSNAITNTTNSAFAALPTASLESGSGDASVLQANQGQGAGTTTVDYSKPGSSTASLNVPGNTPANTYNAPITWTLTPTTTSKPTA